VVKFILRTCTKDAGLEKNSIVNLAQIRTIDKKRLRGSRVTALSDELMEMINQAIKNSLAL
jgi:mRNA interferase MazF